MAFSKYSSIVTAARNGLDLSQDELARRVTTTLQNAGTLPLDKEVSRVMLSKHEAGTVLDPSPEFLQAYFQQLNLDNFRTLMSLIKDKYATLLSDKDQLIFDLIFNLTDRQISEHNLTDVSPEIAEKLRVSSIKAKTKWLTRVTLLDMEGLATWEKHLRGDNNFWIVAHDVIEPSNKFFRDALIEQLRDHGSRYTFFLPEALTIDFLDMKNAVKKELGDDVTRLRMVELDDSKIREWTDNDALFFANPTNSPVREIFRCISSDKDAHSLNEMYAISANSPRTLKILQSIRKEVSKLFENDAEMYGHITNP